MKKNLIYIEEPKLEFGFNQTTEDCRDGLTLFGPYSQNKAGIIRSGIVSTRRGSDLYTSFVKKINAPIYTKSLGRPFFPGFESVFGLKWPSVPEVSLNLEQTEIDRLIGIKNLHERSYQLVSLFLDKINKYIKNEEKTIDIWFIVIPKVIWQNCRPKSKSGKASVSKSEVTRFNSGQMTLFPEDDEIVEQYVDMYESDTDFHDQLKARALQSRLQTPIQIILEETLGFINKGSDEAYDDDMKSHLAWTQSSTLYYKLGCLPWKLTGVREGVCYIGLVFKRFQDSLTQKGFACSAAQMFLDTGDGIVFRGNIGPWLGKNEKTFHLDKSSAKELIRMAVDSYFDINGKYPNELFIHGRTNFSNDEWAGFKDALDDNISTNVVGITIKGNDGLKILNNSSFKDCNYGNLRGLAYVIDEKSGYLWTRGYIPKTNTSNHLEISNPLKITISRGNADIDVVLRDILALTKLNYNACIYGDGLPVTLRFSDNIGDILTAVKDINWTVKAFKYYI